MIQIGEEDRVGRRGTAWGRAGARARASDCRGARRGARDELGRRPTRPRERSSDATRALGGRRSARAYRRATVEYVSAATPDMARAEASGERATMTAGKATTRVKTSGRPGRDGCRQRTRRPTRRAGHCARRAYPPAFVATHLPFRANGVESRDAPRGERGGAPRAARVRVLVVRRVGHLRCRPPQLGRSSVVPVRARLVGPARSRVRALGEGDPSRRWRALDSRRAVAVSAERPPRRLVPPATSTRSARHLLRERRAPPRPRAPLDPSHPDCGEPDAAASPTTIPGGRAPRVGRRPARVRPIIHQRLHLAVTKLDNRLSRAVRAWRARARRVRRRARVGRRSRCARDHRGDGPARDPRFISILRAVIVPRPDPAHRHSPTRTASATSSENSARIRAVPSPPRRPSARASGNDWSAR